MNFVNRLLRESVSGLAQGIVGTVSGVLAATVWYYAVGEKWLLFAFMVGLAIGAGCVDGFTKRR
jgi:hypothetical protein